MSQTAYDSQGVYLTADGYMLECCLAYGYVCTPKYKCNELRVIWPVPHAILSVITRSTIIT